MLFQKGASDFHIAEANEDFPLCMFEYFNYVKFKCLSIFIMSRVIMHLHSEEDPFFKNAGRVDAKQQHLHKWLHAAPKMAIVKSAFTYPLTAYLHGPQLFWAQREKLLIWLWLAAHVNTASASERLWRLGESWMPAKSCKAKFGPIAHCVCMCAWWKEGLYVQAWVCVHTVCKHMCVCV